MNRAMWYLFFSVISTYASQPDTLKSKIISSGLQLNAKGVLIQTNSSDEYFMDSGSNALPPTVPLKTQAMDSSDKSRDSTSNVIDTKKTGFLKQNPLAGMSSPELLKTKEMFKTLGGYHKLMGIYGMVTGVLGIVAGVVLLDRADDTPFAVSFITLGGISIGLGMWEIDVGGKLTYYSAAAK
jgi:hypothetical protein